MGDQHLRNHYHACFPSRFHGTDESADRMGVDKYDGRIELLRIIGRLAPDEVGVLQSVIAAVSR